MEKTNKTRLKSVKNPLKLRYNESLFNHSIRNPNLSIFANGFLTKFDDLFQKAFIFFNILTGPSSTTKLINIL